MTFAVIGLARIRFKRFVIRCLSGKEAISLPFNTSNLRDGREGG